MQELPQPFVQLCNSLGLNTECWDRLSEMQCLPSPNLGYILSNLSEISEAHDQTVELESLMISEKEARRALFRIARLHRESFNQMLDEFSKDPESIKENLGLSSPPYERIRDGFPFPQVRPTQEAIMDMMREALLDDNIENIIVEAPTGIGKSGLAVSTMLSCQNAWLVTANKMLQTQYILEFPWMADFRGRSNYHCSKSPGKNCANASCQGSKGGRAECSKNWECDYHIARSRAMNLPYTTMNLSALLIHSMYKTGVDTDYELRTPHERPVLIIDEAHNLPEAITGVIEISIALEKLDKIGLREIPDYQDPLQYVGFLKQVQELTEDALDDENVGQDVAKEIEIIRALKDKVEHLITELDSNFDNWVLDKEYDEYRQVSAIKFNPVRVDQYWPRVSRLGQKVVMLSATIIDYTTYMELLGLDPKKTKIIKAESPFPPESRPIYTRFMTEKGLNMHNLDQHLPAMVNSIQRILDHYQDSKGIIHGNTYKICLYLRDKLNSDRILFPESAAEQADMLKRHKRSKNTVLLSPSMTEGVDLKGDLARFQVICKMPYPYLGDPLIRKRKELYFGYYGLKTSLTLIQAYGRTTRNMEDWSHTFVLDRNFENFLHINGHNLPKWFSEAIQL